MKRILTLILILSSITAWAQQGAREVSILWVPNKTTNFPYKVQKDKIIFVGDSARMFILDTTFLPTQNMLYVCATGKYRVFGGSDTTGFNIAQKQWVLARSYRSFTNHDSLSALDEKSYNSLTDKPTIPSSDSAAFIRNNSRLTTFLKYGDKLNVGSSATPDSTAKITGGLNVVQGLKTGYDAKINGVTIGKGNGAVFSNTAMGLDALKAVTTANYSTAIGYGSLAASTSVGGNTSIGGLSMNKTTMGSQNTAIGVQSLLNNIVGVGNTATGYSSLYTNTGSYNTAYGYVSLYANSSGRDNTAIGGFSLRSNTTGYSNTAIGVSALYSNTTKSNLVAIGDSSQFTNVTGFANTAVGSKSMYGNISGFGNTAVGSGTLYTVSNKNNNTAIGYSVLQATSGQGNTAVGSASMTGGGAGSYNSALGIASLGSTTSGYSNTTVGVYSLPFNTTGHNNIALGDSAGYSYTTLSNRMYLGARDSSTTGIYWDRIPARNIGWWNGSMYVKTVPYTASNTATMKMLVQDTVTGQFKRTLIASGGSGTVTSIATGYGLSGGTITTTGTLIVDTTVIWSAVRASHVSSYPTFNQSTTGSAGRVSNSLTNGFGIASFSFDGSSVAGVKVDTTALQTKTLTTSQLATKWAKSDTTATLETKAYNNSKLALKAPLSHTQAISTVTGLQDSLADSWNKRDTASAAGILSKARATSTYQPKGSYLTTAVTSVATGLGLTGGTITTTGTLAVDTSHAQILSRLRASHEYQPKGTYGAGTVTNITMGYGLSSTQSPLTSTGTMKADSTVLWSTVRASHLSSYPTLNQNTSGTAAGISLAGSAGQSYRYISGAWRAWADSVKTYTGTSPIVVSSLAISADTAKLVMFNDTIGTGGTGKIQTKYNTALTYAPKASPTFTGTNTLVNAKYTAIPGTDHTTSGDLIALTATASSAIGDAGFIASTGKVTFCKADVIANAPYCLVICADATISADASGNWLTKGSIRDDTWNWTVGGLIYISTTGTTANTLTQTAPSGANNVIMAVGVALSADVMYFFGNLIPIEHN
jgi:hypothetical protein